MIDQLCQIMQNKANFRNGKMDITFYFTKDYEDEIFFRPQKNKPNPST